MQVKIDQIRLIKELYPRFELDNTAVNLYRTNLENLPPILVNQDHILIDGYHRLVAHRIEQKETIEAEIINTSSDGDVLVEAIRRNSTHGKQLSYEEKKELARKLYQNGFKENLKELQDILAVHLNTLNNWLRDLKEQERDKRDRDVLGLFLKCLTQEEIAERVEVTQKTVSNILEKITNCENFLNPPDSLQMYNLWSFPSLSEDQLKYPGQLPRGLIENLLWYHTKPFDIVYDPFAGSGVMVEVCKQMFRRYQVSDIAPIIEEIRKHDITQGFPDWLVKPDFIFLDPPYWSMKKGEYSKDETNLANLPLDRFYREIEKIALRARKVLREGGRVAIITSASQEQGQVYDHALVFYEIFRKRFEYLNRYIVPYTREQVSAAQVEQAERGKYCLKIYRDLLVFKKV